MHFGRCWVVFSDSLALSASIALFFVPKDPLGPDLGQNKISKKYVLYGAFCFYYGFHCYYFKIMPNIFGKNLQQVPKNTKKSGSVRERWKKCEKITRACEGGRKSGKKKKQYRARVVEKVQKNNNIVREWSKKSIDDMIKI